MEKAPEGTFQDELEWCIQQLETCLLHQFPTPKQVGDVKQILKVLRSREAPSVQKQAVMSQVFGDYHQRIAVERRKAEKTAMKLSSKLMQEGDAQTSGSVSYRKCSSESSERAESSFSPSDNSFMFSFSPCEEDLLDNPTNFQSVENAECNEASCSDHFFNHKEYVNSSLNRTAAEKLVSGFTFNFSVPEEAEGHKVNCMAKEGTSSSCPSTECKKTSTEGHIIRSQTSLERKKDLPVSEKSLAAIKNEQSENVNELNSANNKDCEQQKQGHELISKKKKKKQMAKRKGIEQAAVRQEGNVASTTEELAKSSHQSQEGSQAPKETFQDELEWCIQQLETSLLLQIPTPQQVGGIKRILKVLRSPKASSVQKRAVMSKFGDYRQTIAVERREAEKNAMKLSSKLIQEGDGQTSGSVSYRKCSSKSSERVKSCFSPSDNSEMLICSPSEEVLLDSPTMSDTFQSKGNAECTAASRSQSSSNHKECVTSAIYCPATENLVSGFTFNFSVPKEAEGQKVNFMAKEGTSSSFPSIECKGTSTEVNIIKRQASLERKKDLPVSEKSIAAIKNDQAENVNEFISTNNKDCEQQKHGNELMSKKKKKKRMGKRTEQATIRREGNVPSTEELAKSSHQSEEGSQAPETTFQDELEWCIQQLEACLLYQIPTSQEVGGVKRLLKLLRSPKAPFVQKRAAMRMFGDYRQTMAEERREAEKTAMKISSKLIQEGDGQKSGSVSYRKSSSESSERVKSWVSPSDNKFMASCSPCEEDLLDSPTKSDNFQAKENADCKAASCSQSSFNHKEYVTWPATENLVSEFTSNFSAPEEAEGKKVEFMVKEGTSSSCPSTECNETSTEGKIIKSQTSLERMKVLPVSKMSIAAIQNEQAENVNELISNNNKDCEQQKQGNELISKKKKKKQMAKRKGAEQAMVKREGNIASTEELAKSSHQSEEGSPAPETTFQDELEWCIQQLEASLLHQIATSQGVSDVKRILKVLRSHKTSFVEKRAVMRLMFGDYRQTMAVERREAENTAMKLSSKLIQEDDGQKSGSMSHRKCSSKSSERVKSLFSPSDSKFMFNFSPCKEDLRDSPTKSDNFQSDGSAECKEASCSESSFNHKESVTSSLNWTATENLLSGFTFNFSVPKKAEGQKVEFMVKEGTSSNCPSIECKGTSTEGNIIKSHASLESKKDLPVSEKSIAAIRNEQSENVNELFSTSNKHCEQTKQGNELISKKKKKKQMAKRKETEQATVRQEGNVASTEVLTRSSHQSEGSQGHEQLQKEVHWCIEQLEMGLKRQKVTQKQADEVLRAVKTLRSEKAAVVKKRQIMRAMLGDYRKKMEEENGKQLQLLLAATKSARVAKVRQEARKSSSSVYRKCRDKAQNHMPDARLQGMSASSAESTSQVQQEAKANSDSNVFVFTGSTKPFCFNFF